MSADNWDICPKCVHEASAAAEKAAAKVQALYGKVPVEEFDAKRAALKPVDNNDYRTFREDYQVGIEDGAVEVDYRGHCSVCGLEAILQESREFWSPKSA